MDIIKRKQILEIVLILDCVVIVAIISLMTANHALSNKSVDKVTIEEENQIKTTEFALETTPKEATPINEQPTEVSKQIQPDNQTTANSEIDKPEEVVTPAIVYDGMTMEELSAKLDRSLNSTLSGKGSLFANYALELGIDPYLSVAIVLHETGCKWDCSQLVKQCNNVGGQIGSPSCGTTGYKAYSTIDEGIKGFMDNLYYNYYAQGLTTPETINTKYASSNTWATKINNYIAMIKAN